MRFPQISRKPRIFISLDVPRIWPLATHRSYVNIKNVNKSGGCLWLTLRPTGTYYTLYWCLQFVSLQWQSSMSMIWSNCAQSIVNHASLWIRHLLSLSDAHKQYYNYIYVQATSKNTNLKLRKYSLAYCIIKYMHMR